MEHLERTTSKLDRLALWQKDEAHPVGLALAQVAKALEALGHEVGQQQQERTESLAAEIRLLNRTLAKMEDRSHETQA